MEVDLSEDKRKDLIKDCLNHPIGWCADFQKYCKFYAFIRNWKYPHACLLEGYTNNMLTCPDSKLRKEKIE